MDLIQRLHHQVWSRFVRMPQGHLLDYADAAGHTTIPTAEECHRAMPNALGWWTPIENGAFFTGLYLYALIERYKCAPSEQAAKEIQILARGLVLLHDVAQQDGFIARGVADDGVAHYPFSSEDQLVPWMLGMYAFLRCDLCNEPEAIRARLLKTLLGIKNSGWKNPTEIAGMCIGDWSKTSDWRGVCKLLYTARLIYELTGDAADLAVYEALRDSVPEGWHFTRLQIASHGFSHDMLRTPALKQSWIFVAAHLGLRELSVFDPAHATAYHTGTVLNGVTALRFIDDMNRYDNVADGFDLNWRQLAQHWKPIGEDATAAIDHAGSMGVPWGRDIVPHRHMEHTVLGFSLFYAWIAVTCGETSIARKAKAMLEENCARIDWDTLHQCYAFAAESALIVGA